MTYIYQLEIAKLMHNQLPQQQNAQHIWPFTAVNSVHTHKTRSSTSGQYTTVIQSAPNVEKDQSSSKAQEPGSK